MRVTLDTNPRRQGTHTCRTAKPGEITEFAHIVRVGSVIEPNLRALM